VTTHNRKTPFFAALIIGEKFLLPTKNTPRLFFFRRREAALTHLLFSTPQKKERKKNTPSFILSQRFLKPPFGGGFFPPPPKKIFSRRATKNMGLSRGGLPKLCGPQKIPFESPPKRFLGQP